MTRCQIENLKVGDMLRITADGYPGPTEHIGTLGTVVFIDHVDDPSDRRQPRLRVMWSLGADESADLCSYLRDSFFLAHFADVVH